MSDTNKPEKIPLTTRESELVVIGMQCLSNESGLKLNWEKFTTIAEYKNVASARTNFQAVLKKLSEGTVDKYYVAQSSVTTLAAPKKRAAKPKATKATATDGNDNAENGTTSKKRVRKAKLPDTGNNGDLHAVKSESEAPDAKRVKPDPELAVKKEEEPSDMSNDAA